MFMDFTDISSDECAADTVFESSSIASSWAWAGESSWTRRARRCSQDAEHSIALLLWHASSKSRISCPTMCTKNRPMIVQRHMVRERTRKEKLAVVCGGFLCFSCRQAQSACKSGVDCVSHTFSKTQLDIQVCLGSGVLPRKSSKTQHSCRPQAWIALEQAFGMIIAPTFPLACSQHVYSQALLA